MEIRIDIATRQYGSGYPGVSGLGTTGRNFPFVYWPLVWGGGLGYGAAYLHNTHEVSISLFVVCLTTEYSRDSMESPTTQVGQAAR